MAKPATKKAAPRKPRAKKAAATGAPDPQSGMQQGEPAKVKTAGEELREQFDQADAIAAATLSRAVRGY